MRKMFYSPVFKVRKKRERKKPATQASRFRSIKKIMIFHKPELKIGEGGGCMTFFAVAKTTRSVMIYRIFAVDVNHEILKSHKPSCSKTPVTAKMMARRKRGSARNKPFQLVCMAISERGR